MKIRSKLPSIKREIKDFLLSEEGKITKKDIVKIGMSLAVLSLLFTPETVNAGHISSFHQDANRGGHNSNHVSHGSHGSHGQW